jgi:hypothetical protein
MKSLVGVFTCIACVALFVTPAAQAHKLTAKKAEAALQPSVEEMTAQAAPKIAAVLPGATISKTTVDCVVTKKGKHGHLAECSFDFDIAGASTGETVCSQPARVKFRSKTSKQLKIAIAPAVACIFVVQLA